jgi:hypothetical protein
MLHATLKNGKSYKCFDGRQHFISFHIILNLCRYFYTYGPKNLRPVIIQNDYLQKKRRILFVLHSGEVFFCYFFFIKKEQKKNENALKFLEMFFFIAKEIFIL